MSFAVNSPLAEISTSFSEQNSGFDFLSEDILNEPVFVSDDDEDDVIDETEEIHLRTRFRSSRSRCYTDRSSDKEVSREDFVHEMAHQLQIDHVKRIVGQSHIPLFSNTPVLHKNNIFKIFA